MPPSPRGGSLAPSPWKQQLQWEQGGLGDDHRYLAFRVGTLGGQDGNSWMVGEIQGSYRNCSHKCSIIYNIRILIYIYIHVFMFKYIYLYLYIYIYVYIDMYISYTFVGGWERGK